VVQELLFLTAFSVASFRTNGTDDAERLVSRS
jgi:hypothetical protein